MQVRLILLILIAVLLGLILTPVCAATRSEYDGLLASVSSDLQNSLRMERAKAGSSTPVLTQLSNSLPASMTVQDGGESTEVDLSWIRQGVIGSLAHRGSSRIDDLKQLIPAVDTLASADVRAPGTDRATALKAKAVLAEILKRKEYKQSWLSLLTARFWKFIGRMLGKVFGAKYAPLVGKIILWGLVAAFALAVVFLVLNLISGGKRRPLREQRGRGPIGAKKIRPTIESLLERAEQEAAERRYRDAFRSIYLATILRLDRAGLVGYAESRTNWEYLTSVRKKGNPDAIKTFSTMTSEFDDLIYGQREVAESGYSSMLSRFRELEGQL